MSYWGGEVINRLYFVRKHSTLYLVLCCYALIGQFLVSAALALAGRPCRLVQLIGQLQGLVAVLSRTPAREGGILK